VIIRLDPASAVPPYAQLRDQIATMIRSGVVATDARLPAIRHLANDLGVAVNTVGRAYRELELEGLVATRGRHGTVVLPPSTAPAGGDGEELAGVASSYVLEVTHRGIDLDQAIDAVRAAFRRLEQHGGTT
jgi:DNA-binding transcriptional regulator YhcF (GntR family)